MSEINFNSNMNKLQNQPGKFPPPNNLRDLDTNNDGFIDFSEYSKAYPPDENLSEVDRFNYTVDLYANFVKLKSYFKNEGPNIKVGYPSENFDEKFNKNELPIEEKSYGMDGTLHTTKYEYDPKIYKLKQMLEVDYKGDIKNLNKYEYDKNGNIKKHFQQYKFSTDSVLRTSTKEYEQINKDTWRMISSDGDTILGTMNEFGHFISENGDDDF